MVTGTTKERKTTRIQTERGVICIVHNYDTAREAETDGYSYAFTSRMLNCDIYSLYLDGRGFCQEFVTVGQPAIKH